MNWNRERWKILAHRSNYGRLATVEDISECAKALQRLAVQYNRPFMITEQVNIWDWYQDQKGGGLSCGY
jgi:inorganic pyrophosphatase